MKKPLALASILAVGAFSSTPSYAQFDQWNVATGDWTVNANWLDGSTPNATENAVVSNGGTANITSNVTANNVGLGIGSGQSGTINVNATGAANFSALTVGLAGNGTLNSDNGSLTIATSVTIAANPGSHGTLKLDGASANLTLFGDTNVGQGGNGSLQIFNGATYNATGNNLKAGVTNGVGQIVLQNGGTLANVGSAVIGDNGLAFLNIFNSSNFSAAETVFGLIGNGFGNININSTLQTGNMVVGQSGNATINTNNGTVNVTSNLVLGQNSGSNGTMIFTGNLSVLNVGGTTIIGNSSMSTGNISLQNGASFNTNTLTVASSSQFAGLEAFDSQISVNSSLVVGSNTGSFGSVSLNASNMTVGSTSIFGDAGFSFFSLTNNSIFQANSNVLILGFNGGVGNINANEGSKILGVSTARIGVVGFGFINLNQNSTFNATTIKVGETASGIFNADNSTVNILSNVIVGEGNGSFGSVLLSNNAIMTTGGTTSFLGQEVNSNGSFNLFTNATWNFGGQNLVVGNNGTGQFSLNSGGKFNGSNLTIAQNPGSSGTLLISDNGSQAILSGDIVSKGSLTVKFGGELTADKILMSGPANTTVTGNFSNGRGQISTKFIQSSTTGDLLVFDGGRFRPLANISEAFPGFDAMGTGNFTILNEGLFFNTNSVNVSTTAFIRGNGALTVNGSGQLELLQPSIYSAGTKVEDTATLRVNNTSGSATGSGPVNVGPLATLAGAGRIFGPAIVLGSIAPGNSIGNLTIVQNTTWSSGASWLFELGIPAVSQNAAASGLSTQDKLVIQSGDFIKAGTGPWTFDFLNTGAVGWYQLVTWGNSTTFSSADFVATNLPSGFTGNFSIVGNALYLDVIPEPASVLLILGAAGLWGLSKMRRRTEQKQKPTSS